MLNKDGTVKFARFSRDEERYVQEIAERARGMFPRFLSQAPSVLEIRMDLAAVHAAIPLRLDEFAAADNFNFSHDIGGIYKHLNRETGDLEDCFVPRFARPDRSPRAGSPAFEDIETEDGKGVDLNKARNVLVKLGKK